MMRPQHPCDQDGTLSMAMRFISGRIIDVGCGDCKVVPSALGVGLSAGNAVSVVVDNLHDACHHDFIRTKIPFDTVFSAYVLAHQRDDYRALSSWIRLIDRDGHIVLCLRDGTKYIDPKSLHCYHPDVFERWVLSIPGMGIVSSGSSGRDFFVVIRRN